MAPDEYVWLNTPAPDAKVKFLPAAIVVAPFNDTLPVPVENVLAPDWEKLPEAEISPVKEEVPVTERFPAVEMPVASTAK